MLPKLKTPAKTAILIGLLSAVTLSAEDELTRIQADSLLKRGHHLLSVRRPEPARQCFKRIRKSFKEDVEAMMGMAEADFQERKWGNADNWYDRALDREPDRVAAHYGKAICKRESGKNMVLVQRLLVWRSSRKHFRRVVELDSTYRDALYQWALLERFDRNFKEAILLTHRQMRKMMAPEIQIGILKMYDYYLAHTSAEDAESWLLPRKSPYDLWALGEFYRRHEKFDEADSIFEGVINNPGRLPIQSSLLSRVRLCVQTEQPELAEELYWRTIKGIRGVTGVEVVLQDFMPIITEAEYALLQNQITLNTFQDAIRQFWANRNPLPASPRNHRLLEHYRRLVFAETHYRYDGFRHTLNVTDKSIRFDRPVWQEENYKFSDPGLIYIRYGDPDERSFAVSDDLPENMSWLYYAGDGLPKLIFHFSVHENAPPGLWTLTSGFEDLQIIEGMLHWDNVYQDLYTASSENEFFARFHEMASSRAEMAKIALRRDRHSWGKETEVLEMYQKAYRFRDGEKGDVLQVDFAVPEAALFSDTTKSILLETGLAVFDDRMHPLFQKSEQVELDRSQDARFQYGYFIQTYDVPVGVKSCNIAIHGRIPDGNRLNAWKYQYSADTSGQEILKLSDLKLAFDIRSEPGSVASHRTGLTIIPNPACVFGISDPVFAYYEAYNLVFDETGRTRYETNFTLRKDRSGENVFKKMFGWIGGGNGYKISLRHEQEAESRDIADYISFDVSQADAGKYELFLIVKDLISGERTESRVEFELK